MLHVRHNCTPRPLSCQRGSLASLGHLCYNSRYSMTIAPEPRVGYAGIQQEGFALSEKEKALDLALAQIERTHGKGAVMRLGDRTALQVEAIPTGSIALDIAL